MVTPATSGAALHSVLLDAVHRAVAQNFRGYDPYDGLSTRHAALRRTRSVRLAMMYLNKFSPLNLRRFLGITPHVTPAAVAVVSRVLLRRDRAEHAGMLAQNVDFLLSKSLRARYGRHCWNGIDFPLQMRNEYQTPDVPGVIGTAACSHFLLDYYEFHPDREDLAEIALSVRDFLLETLLEEYEGAVFFRYKPITPRHRCTYNASVIAAGLVARINAVFAQDTGNDAVTAAMRFVAQRQHADGRWNYVIDLRSGVEKPQVDYHQGFVLDQLMAWLTQHDPDAMIETACRRGLSFYREQQFTDQGRSLYRWPRAWPVSIANQAQGIATFARAGQFGQEYPAFARTIAAWTVRHMYDAHGFFHYLKYPLFTNRIPYLRVAQAAMIEALDVLLSEEAAIDPVPHAATPSADSTPSPAPAAIR